MDAEQGVAVFSLSGGSSIVTVHDRGAEIEVENHKGDLTIRIPQFDAHDGWTIDVTGDHRFVIASHNRESGESGSL